jgi:hypothetical protein
MPLFYHVSAENAKTKPAFSRTLSSLQTKEVSRVSVDTSFVISRKNPRKQAGTRREQPVSLLPSSQFLQIHARKPEQGLHLQPCPATILRVSHMMLFFRVTKHTFNRLFALCVNLLAPRRMSHIFRPL